MIVAQERGLKFEKTPRNRAAWYCAESYGDGQDVFSDMKKALNIENYLKALDDEGEAFRQRFVDYTPPEEA